MREQTLPATCLVLLIISSSLLKTAQGMKQERSKRVIINNDPSLNDGSDNHCPSSNLFLERSFRCNSGQFKVERACNEDALEIYCDKPLVVAVHSALFGWHGKGRGLRCSGKFPTPEVCPTTCLTDQIRFSCNGRRRCDVDSSNDTLQDLVKCGHPYKTFLEITYTCLERHVFKSLEQNRLDDRDPCIQEKEGRRGKKTNNSEKQFTKNGYVTTKSLAVTTFYRYGNFDDDDDDDDDVISSGNGVRDNTSHDIKDSYWSTRHQTIKASYDLEKIDADNNNDDGDDDIDLTIVTSDDGDDEVDNTEERAIATTDIIANYTSSFEGADETILLEGVGDDDRVISNSSYDYNEATATNRTIDDDDGDDEEGIYFNNDESKKTYEDDIVPEHSNVVSSFNDSNRRDEDFEDAFQVDLANLDDSESNVSTTTDEDERNEFDISDSLQATANEGTNPNVDVSDANKSVHVVDNLEDIDNPNMSSYQLPSNFKAAGKDDVKVKSGADGGRSNTSFISEWHWIWKHVTENTEKFILYIALAICLGIIGALTSALIKATRCCACESDHSSPSSEHHHHARKGGEKSYRIDINSTKECSGRRNNKKKKKKKQDEANSVSWRIPGSESSTGDDRTLDEDEDEDDEETGDAVRLASYNHIDSLQRRTASNSVPSCKAEPYSLLHKQQTTTDPKPPTEVEKVDDPTNNKAASINDISSKEIFQRYDANEHVTSNTGNEQSLGQVTKRRSIAAGDFTDLLNHDFQELSKTKQEIMLENSQAVQNLQATLQKQKQHQMLQNQQKILQQQQVLQSQRNNTLQKSQAKQNHSQLSLYSSNSLSQNTCQLTCKTSHSSSTAETPLDSIHSSPVRRHQEKANHFHHSPVRSLSRNTTPEPGTQTKSSIESEMNKNPPITLPLPPPPSLSTSPYQVSSAATNSTIHIPLPPPPPSSGSFPPFPPLPSPPPEHNDSFFSNECEESSRYVRSEFRRLDTTSAKVAPSPSYASINGTLTEQLMHQNHQREQIRNSNTSINHHLQQNNKITPGQKPSLINGDVYRVRHQPINLELEKGCSSIGGFSQQNQLPPPLPVSLPPNKPPSKSQSDFNDFKSNGIPKSVANGEGSHYSQINACNMSKDAKKENVSTIGGNLASSSMNGIFNSQYNYHAPCSSNHNATTAFNPSAVSDRSLEKSATSRHQQQVVIQHQKSRESQKINQVPFSSETTGKPMVAKKLSVDAYFSTLPSSPLPTSSYSPPEPYRPDASVPINSYHYHHKHQHNASPLHQRNHYQQHQNGASNVRKSSLTGSLGRAYSGHLLYLNDGDRNLIGGGSLANGRDIYLSQLATAASAAREQLHLGYGVVGGGMPANDEEVRRYRTLQPNFNHFYG